MVCGVVCEEVENFHFDSRKNHRQHLTLHYESEVFERNIYFNYFLVFVFYGVINSKDISFPKPFEVNLWRILVVKPNLNP